MIVFYLGEKPILNNVPTYMCRNKDDLAYTLAHLKDLVVKEVHGAGGYGMLVGPAATKAEVEEFRAHLLANLRGLPRPWTAHFHCTTAVALPGGELYLAEGQVFGEILPEERGSNGFGYDPLFLLPELGRTMAELTREEKNTLSHRARALHAALPAIRKLLGL